MFHSLEITGTFRPLQDWVIVAPDEPEAEEGGIAIPDVARKERYRRCRVVAVGPGFRTYRDGVYGKTVIPTELKPGDVIAVQKFVEGELSFSLNGETVFAIRERHVNVAVVESPE